MLSVTKCGGVANEGYWAAGPFVTCQLCSSAEWCCLMRQLSTCEFSLVHVSKSRDSESPSAALMSEAQLQFRGEVGTSPLHFGRCLDDSGRGEDGTGQSWLNNSFPPHLFTAEDFLARGGPLVPVSEHSSSAVCWEKLVSSTTGAQNTSGWCGLCWSWKNMVYLWPFLD